MEKLTYKSDHKVFQDEISRREIDSLIHFTPTKNLFSILENDKIMSRDMLESLDIEQFDILDYAQFTDEVRYDDKNYINLSISFPNNFLFSKFRERTSDDITLTWCVLKINPKFLYVADTLFSVTNAASYCAKKQYGITGDYKKFQSLFAESLVICTTSSERTVSRGRLLPKYTTDVQAEVLVRNEIPAMYIDEVCFNNDMDLAITKAALSQFDTSNFIVKSSLFTNNRV